MPITEKCVLLLKAEKSDESEDKYEVMLKEQGFAVKHLKTLEFVFKNLEELKRKLEAPELYNGIIFTTPRSVKAAKQCLDKSILNSEWKTKSNYVVGETTHDLVLKEFNLNCNGQNSGNANNLADVIIKDKFEISKPFLFPCGNLKTDTLVNRLCNEEINIETITVYETIPSRSLEGDFHILTSDFTDIPEYFVYFSPSGVQSTVNFLGKLTCENVKFIAIGPTTETALQNHNIKVKAVAVKPTPKDVLSAILS